MSATSGCSGPTTVTPQPTTALKQVDKNPPAASTIVLSASPTTNNNVNVNSTSNSIVVGDLISTGSITKTETSTNSLNHNNVQQQPIDLAQNATTSGQQLVSGLRTSPSVLQLRPIGTLRSNATAAKGVPISSSIVLTSPATNVSNHNSGMIHQPASIISVNRTGSNVTILPAKVPFQASNGSATLQFPRGATILRPAGPLNASCQSGSITVTPISGSSIRLASATVNNGWMQTSSNSQATFTPIRPIQVTARGIRPDAKVIHIPPQGVQHLTQLQVLDSKGTTILKPHLSSTPIIRTIQTSSTSVSVAPIPPSFTIRTASMPSSKANSTPTLQKVITQSTHGPSIQLVGGKLPQHAIQTITPIPRLTISNPACLTISTSGPLNSTNTTPVVAVASKGGGGTANIIMGPNTINPLTKIYDVNPLLNMLSKNQAPLTSSGSVTISVSSTNTTLPNNATNAQITATTNSPMQSTTNPGIHHVVQIHGPLNGPGQTGNSNIATIGLTQTNTTSNFYVGQKGVNFVQAGTTIPIRPLTIERKQEIRPNPTNKGNHVISTGQMILTQTGNPPLSNTGPVAISIGPHTFAHPITLATTPQQPGILTTSLTGIQAITSAVSTIPSSGGLSSNTINVIGGQQQTLTLSGNIITTPQSSQDVLNVIPSHLASQSVSTSSTPSTSSFTSTVPSTTSVIVTTASAASNSSSTPSIPSVPITSPSIIVSNPTNGASSNATIPAVPSPSPSQQSASQSKTNLSPRPSILRKRDAPTNENIQLRAQRNLALNFNLPSSNASSASIPTNTSSVSATISATAAANKENNAASTMSLPGSVANNGLGLLKKDFQPPNEESSWQSCSSNSSSGSTTLSTTSETAEIQLQQSLGVTITNLSNVSSSSIYNVSNGVNTTASTPTAVETHSTFSSATLNSQNGSFRTTNTPSGRSRLSSTSKAFNKDLDRVKGVKGKEDHVSPRKKPRKQQLPTGDPLEPASSEISFYQGKRLKRNEILDPSLFQGFPDKLITEPNRDEAPSLRICYIVKRPHYSLLESDKLTVKSRLNHFQKYSDVKPKDEKRPSLNELANQKDVFTKINGWKLQHLNNHLEEVIQSETNIVSDFNSLLDKIDAKTGPNANIRDLNRLQELLKGNIQRCKVIKDQMSEAKCQVSKILDHKGNISDILSKYVNKRPTKKRERL